MACVEIDIANSTLHELLQRAAGGEDVVITANGIPTAKLVAIAPPNHGKRKLGQLAGRYKLPDNFDDPLPDDILAAFEGR